MTEKLAEIGDVIRFSIPVYIDNNDIVNIGFRGGDRAVVTNIDGFSVFCKPLDIPMDDIDNNDNIEIKILHGEYHVIPLSEIREEKIKKLLNIII